MLVLYPSVVAKTWLLAPCFVMAKGQPRNWPLRNKSETSVAFSSHAREFDWGQSADAGNGDLSPGKRALRTFSLHLTSPCVIVCPSHAQSVESRCTTYVTYLETGCHVFKKQTNVI